MLPAGGVPSLRGGVSRGLGLTPGQLPGLSNSDLLQGLAEGFGASLARGGRLEHEDEVEEGDQGAPAAQPSAAATEQTQRLTELVTLQEQLEHMLNTGDPDEAYVCFNPLYLVVPRALYYCC